MALVTIIDRRSGQAREVDERSARILVGLGKAIFANEPVRTLDQEYMTRSMEAAPAKRRGRPPKSKEQ